MKGEIQRNPQAGEVEEEEEKKIGQGMKIRSLEEDESDLMGTINQGGGAEEAGAKREAAAAEAEAEEINEKNDSGEGSSLMALDPGSFETSSSSSRYRKRSLVEIFSVLLLEKDDTSGVDQVLQESLLLSTRNRDGIFKEHVLCDLSAGKPLQHIDSQSYLILTGPQHGVEILDTLSISPSYDAFYKRPYTKKIWHKIREEYDIFICDWPETLNGFMVVKFAVFRDGLEARLELTVSDLELCGIPLDLYGTVTTSNSALPDSEAKSYLFNHHRTDSSARSPILDLASFGKAEIPLPLSRSVTVIPRDSTLIVDLNLILRCDSGDISIAKESVSFRPATRSNSVEEYIIKGSHAKLKVKVTWVEALERDREGEEGKKEKVVNAGQVTAGEEVTKGGELIDDMDTTSEGSETESDQGTESEDISADDTSHLSLKIRRRSSQEDVSTGAVNYYTTEAMDIADGGQGEVLDNILARLEESGDYYLEVFSIKLLDIENLKLDEIYGFVIIHTGVPPQLLFRRLRGESSKIDSQGFAILEGPQRCAFNVLDIVYIVPFLFKYQEFEFTGEHRSSTLWHDIATNNTDNLLCEILDSDFGRIEVKFAVYENSVWARMTVMLTDCSFSSAQVHGTITVSNSMVQNPDAVSVVFKKEKNEVKHVIVGPEKEISLPLLRPAVAVPLDSIFTVHVEILSHGNLIIRHPFQFRVPLVGEIEQTFPGNGCGVKVHVKSNNKHGGGDNLFY